MKILVVEDELGLLETIREYLEKEGIICETAANFLDAEDKVVDNAYDLVILDISLPGGNGLDILKLIKKLHPEMAVIIISAKDSLEDKLTGLNLGSDDYLTKPFHLSELNARIKAVWRRKQYKGYDILVFNEISLTPERQEARVGSSILDLTRKEFELLLFFVSNRHRVLSKESIAGHLWGDSVDFADNLDFIYTHINNLRKKIIKAGGTDYIRSIYGVGYKFTDQ